jgi:glycosidase
MKNKLDYIKEMGIDSRFTCPILSDSSQCPKNIPD